MTHPLLGLSAWQRTVIYLLSLWTGFSNPLFAQRLIVGAQGGYNGSVVETGLIGNDTRFQSPQQSKLKHGSTAGAFAQMSLSKRLPLYGVANVSGFWHSYQYTSPPTEDYELFRGISSKKFTYSAIRTSLGLAWIKRLHPTSLYAIEFGGGLSGLFIRDIFCDNRDRNCRSADFTADPPKESVAVESLTTFVDYPNVLAAYTRFGFSRRLSERWHAGISVDCQFGFGNFMTIASIWKRYNNGIPVRDSDYRYISVDTGNAFLGQVNLQYVLKP